MDRGKQKLNETSLNEPSASTINYNNANEAAENQDLSLVDSKTHFRGRIRMLSEFASFKERSQRIGGRSARK